METIKIDLKNIKKEDIALVVKYLKKGRVVVLPTDTIYGLHCDANNPDAIQEIYKIKKITRQKPLLILTDSMVMLEKYCYLNRNQKEIINKTIKQKKRPETVVLKSRKILPPEINNGLDSQAVRFLPELPSSPGADFIRAVIKKLGTPLASTSLNISGKGPLDNLKSVSRYFKADKPDLAVDAGKIKGKPSRIVDFRDENKIKVIRE